MPRWGFRLYAVAAIGLALAATGWVIALRPIADLKQLLFFTALVAIASFFLSGARRDLRRL